MTVPERHVLLTTQRNQLFTALQSKGFQPEEFIFYEEDNSAHLSHRSTQYSCRISVGSFKRTGSMGALETYTLPYRLVSSPGRELLQEERYFESWIKVINGFNDWLTCLTGELQTPDLWATISGDTQLIKIAADQDNRPFTPDEQLQVKNALNEIRTYLVQSQQLSQDQAKSIEGRFKYMEEAASRLGRKDYIGIVVTTLLTIAYDQGFSSDVTGDMIKFAGQIFREFLGTLLYLAGPH